ncbi:uncharacterized protein LOC110463794 [Mizuhopecten yessoensis]|uniref:uncharacterized protein LOC110463794 n=1 Tax=Mizuhopecten yessoensis TaxID=6573 RepID=UPI000B45800A|nr:uncharacterized protein LOC110463794 [Mizuhopecten yessoensis]
MGYCSGALFILIVLLQFRGNISSASICYERQYSYYYGYYYYNYYDYCSYGCCGYTTSRFCCYSSYSYDNTYYKNKDSWTSVVVGSTVGSVVFFIVMVIGICCCCKHTNKNKVGRVMVAPAPTGQQGVAIVSDNMNIPMQQQIPGQTYGYLPQGYQAPQAYPPQAYPPQAFPPQAFTPQAYPPPVHHPTVPVVQPGNSTEPIAQSSNIPSAWNSAGPATTQENP